MITVLILVLILAIIAVVLAFIAGSASGIHGLQGLLAKRIEEADISDDLKIYLLKVLVEEFKIKKE